MALGKGKRIKPLKAVKKIAEGAQPYDGRTGSDVRKKAPPVETRFRDHQPDHKKPKTFASVTLHGSKGETYEVVIPANYRSLVPKKWEWTPERYRVAELIANGVPFTQIPNDPHVNIKSRMTIYGWLEHPEFKSHVDGIIMETGWANRRERLQKLQHLNEVLLNKVVKEIDSMKLTDKNVGALLNAIQAGSKLVAQEKGEFIEESKVTQDTNVTGTVTNVSAKYEDFIKSKSEEERKKLEKEFDEVADDIIRTITGSKD